MTEQSKAEELLRRTFGQTTPMRSDERIDLPSQETAQSSTSNSAEETDPLARLDSSEGREERIRRHEEWAKKNPPKPISDELQKQINDLM
jgi:hypothetical protein